MKSTKFKDPTVPFELWGAEEVTPIRNSKKKKINTSDDDERAD